MYDTERKGNNNPIIHINKANNLLTDITYFKESRTFRVAQDFLSKGYIEFETGVLMTVGISIWDKYGYLTGVPGPAMKARRLPYPSHPLDRVPVSITYPLHRHVTV